MKRAGDRTARVKGAMRLPVGRLVQPGICLLLLLLLLPLMGRPALADSPREEGLHEGTAVSINPRFKELVTEKELYALEDISPEEEYELVGAGDSFTYYRDLDQAAADLRGQLAAHLPSGSLGFHCSTTPDSDLMNRIFNLAVVHTGNPKEGDYIHEQWLGSLYRWFWYPNSSGGVDVRLLYWVKWMTNIAQEQYVDRKVAEIMSEMQSKAAYQEERIRFLYEYLCDNIIYDDDNLEDGLYSLKYSAYAGLAHGRCVCNGYACLLYRLLLEAGIDSRVITGGNHAWNIVQFGGSYYYLDATWDAGREYGKYRYFMKAEADFADHTKADRFQTAEFKRKYPIGSSSRELSFFMPAIQGDLQYNLVCGEYTVVGYSGMGTPRSLVIPAYVNGYPVTRIKGDAFNGYDKLVSVTLPKTLKRIEDGSYSGNTVKGAFANCTALSEILAPDGLPQLREIGDYAFFNCDSLCSFGLGGVPLRRMGVCALAYCDRLQQAGALPYSTRRIENAAFAGLKADIYIISRTCVIADTEDVFGKDAVLHGYSGSTAQAWARKYGRRFIAFDVEAHTDDWQPFYYKREPTCKEEGILVYVCSSCGETKEELLDRTEHPFSEWRVIEDKTCTKGEKLERFCPICGITETRTGTAPGHRYGSWRTLVAPTVQSQGEAARYCSGCGAVQYKSLPRLKKTKIRAVDLVLNAGSVITLPKGRTWRLQVALLPSNSTDPLVFTSRNAAIASVSSKGLIKARKKGKTVITVKAGVVKRSITVRVV